MKKIDTHQHLLYPDRFSYDWTAGFPALAQRQFRVEEYHAAAVQGEISESLFMEVDAAPGETLGEAAFFCSLAENPANRIAGVIAACRPENDGFEAHLEATAHPRLCGFRRVLHTQPDDLSTRPIFRENVARIGRAGLTFDLCALPRQASAVAALVDACPGTRFILDHCGNPPIADGADSASFEGWKKGLVELSRRPNLACKISGIIASGTVPVTAGALRPAVEHAVACFGWDRLVWGSDWPVCNLTHDLSTWIRLLDEILSGCSHGELARLYQINAGTIYRIKSFS